jgi:hypothetical protein
VDDARESCSARESSSPLTAFSRLSENENTGSVHSGLGLSFSARQDNFPNYSHHDGDQLPYSPLPDAAHPWDEFQQQSRISVPVTAVAMLQQQPDNSTSTETGLNPQGDSQCRPSCHLCKQSFSNNSGLNRHIETIHEQKYDWFCPVKTCRKYKKPYSRKDNFKRHCEKKHPTTSLKNFGL